MDKYQKAAKTLNEVAPVDGAFGRERVAYLNPLEEQILKSIGGSGEVIIPEAGGKKAGGEVPSYGLFKWIKNKVFDDILGIDNNKTLGIKHKTFLGKGLGTVRDDWLGWDDNKFLGVSDATWDDIASVAAGALGGLPASLAWTAADMVVDNNWSGGERVKAKKAIAAQQEAAREAAKKRAGNMTDDELANSRALAMDLISRGKSGLIDPSDSARLQTLLASPGDEAYIEGESIGGQEIDPFPNRFRESGDFINRTLNNTGRFAEDYIGTEDQRMNDFMPILDRMKGMNLDAISTVGSIYDQGPGGLEAQYRGFQDNFNRLAEDQKRLNMITADSNQGFVNDVISGGDRYADALRGSKQVQTGLTGRAFDELDSLPMIQRLENFERMGRFGDTRMAEQMRNNELRDRLFDTRNAFSNVINERGSRFYDTLNSRLAGQDRLADTRFSNAGRLRDSRFGAADFLRDSEYGASGRRLGSEFGAANRLMDAGYGSADRSLDSRYGAADRLMSSGYGSADRSLDARYGAADRSLDARYGSADGIYGAEQGGIGGISDARYGSADRLGGSRLGASDLLYDSRIGGAEGMRDAMAEDATGIRDAQFGAADRLQDAERVKALLAADNAEMAANAKQRNLASANVGQGTGTGTSMANAMIQARLGQQRGDILADAGIEDARRRGDSEIDYASRMGRTGTTFAGASGDAGIDRARGYGEADVAKSIDLGVADLERAMSSRDSDVRRALSRGDADILRSERLGDADILRSEFLGSVDRENAQRLGDADILRSELLRDIDRENAQRLGDAEIGDATRTGESDIARAGTMGNADIDNILDINRASQDRAEGINRAEEDYFRNLEGNLTSEADLDLAKRMEGISDSQSDVDFARKMEGILDSDADRLGAEIRADRYKTLAELDPGSGEVAGAQADLQNRIRALGYGDQILNAYGANIGIDQGTLDDERKLTSDLTNMRIGNSSLIPSLGMQYAQLPATLLESGLAPMGPLVRNISPYTSTGQLSSPITSFSPIAPPQDKMQWYDYAMMAPNIVSGVRSVGSLFQ